MYYHATAPVLFLMTTHMSTSCWKTNQKINRTAARTWSMNHVEIQKNHNETIKQGIKQTTSYIDCPLRENESKKYLS